ncbi:MAG: putative membrane protein YedE/YeeE [Cryomorphaceae bacterium]|jgi:uncharacterized membrane protein YedE/YeeE
MNLPIPKDSITGLVIAALFGIIFGILLNKGRVTDYNVIVNLFRFKDFTVLKIMLTAIVVGGIGVFAMQGIGWIEGYHIKDTNLLGLILGSGLFGAGMALYGYCPGTAVAAIATGRIHALVGFFGMLLGGIIYAYSYGWIEANILSVGKLGKIRLDEVTTIPSSVWWMFLPIITIYIFMRIERKQRNIQN